MSEIILVSRARLAMARAIAEAKERPAALAVRMPEPAAKAAIAKSRMLEADLPRICAVHDRGYISRYVSGGKDDFRYTQSFRFAEQLGDQYETRNGVTVPSRQLAYETCPWCGALGLGSITCGTCSAEICYGRTTASHYFTCRDSCTGAGHTVATDRDMKGFRPGLKAPGPRAT